jgi:hypothetical protein
MIRKSNPTKTHKQTLCAPAKQTGRKQCIQAPISDQSNCSGESSTSKNARCPDASGTYESRKMSLIKRLHILKRMTRGLSKGKVTPAPTELQQSGNGVQGASNTWNQSLDRYRHEYNPKTRSCSPRQKARGECKENNTTTSTRTTDRQPPTPQSCEPLWQR